MLRSVVRCWHRTLRVEEDEFVTCCNGGGAGGKVEIGTSWTENVRYKVYKTGLGYTWTGREGRDIGAMCQIMKIR